MIIPTDVFDTATIAVPGMSYWDATAAHYYINAPGIGSDEGCKWGDSSQPIGNWSPFVAGANTVADGSTYVKVGLNPVWQESSLSGTKPDFGLEIECPNDDCNGIPCKVDGSGVVSDNEASGAGGSPFCVVTVPKGSKANVVVSRGIYHVRRADYQFYSYHDQYVYLVDAHHLFYNDDVINPFIDVNLIDTVVDNEFITVVNFDLYLDLDINFLIVVVVID
ncbi:putative sun domain protein [Eutypa lata UCREL1]|uniref:Putative sun domain protein n=1 Tax=Eutypa lata (strain UCR-EL1) TaxID=1287681 RepID=M7T452_EUTLA|nr:putative sun domain protein [Eutypa lata UCREL1]